MTGAACALIRRDTGRMHGHDTAAGHRRPGRVTAMSFLDDLKKQAGQLQAGQDDGERSLARNTLIVEGAAKGVRQYLMELAANLDVIRPAPPVRYALDKRIVLEALPRTDFRFDARRKLLREQEVLDYVFIACTVGGGPELQLGKDFVNEIESLERRLEQAVATFDRRPVRQADSGKLIEMRYAFVAAVQVATRVTCLHDQGRLHFAMRNLDGLETVDCEFEAHAVNQGKLDELARWWVGKPNRFLEGALALRRTEAR